jgi:membrane protease YdiL (CAAX protease family)
MPIFQPIALALTAAWLLLVAIHYRRSTVVLVGGMVLVGALTAGFLLTGQLSLSELGVGNARWGYTLGFAVVWTGVMFAYSPLADRIATHFVDKPPTLGAFRAIQQSLPKLLAGIAIAWLLGGILEELVFRGVVLRSVEALLSPIVGSAAAALIAIVAAALGATLIHYYQGPRAMIIIAQLSVLFGVLFVISGHDLLAVMLCHGFYDTIAFIRFAMKKSKYSDLDPGSSSTKPN